MMHNLIHWLENNLLSCFYVKHFGVECPGCGFQRAFILLLKGQLLESLQMYPALLPILCMFAYLPLHLIVKFKNGARNLTWMFVGSTAIVVLNFIGKIILTY